MKQKYIIYGLIDPRTNELRYVGKSSSGLRRPREHLCAKRENGCTHKDRWLRQLYADGGLVPSILVLRECVDNIDALAQEVYLIALFRQAGFPLTNISPGGDGCSGHVITEKQRQAIIAANKRRVWTDEARARASAAHKGYKPSVEAREKCGAALRGRQRTAEVRAKISAAHLGKKHTPEHTEKSAAQHRGFKWTPEQLVKITAARRSPEFRKKQSQSSLAAWAKRKSKVNGSSILGLP